MDTDAFNPYQPPESAQAENQSLPLVTRKRMLAIPWTCSVVVAGYGLFGSVANGVDLIRTRSSVDLIKEGKLVALFGFGLFLCWLTFFATNNKRATLVLPVTILAATGAAYVLYDLS